MLNNLKKNLLIKLHDIKKHHKMSLIININYSFQFSGLD